jgi:hypothetical protein
VNSLRHCQFDRSRLSDEMVGDRVLASVSGYYTLLELQRCGLTRPTDLQKFFTITTNNFV